MKEQLIGQMEISVISTAILQYRGLLTSNSVLMQEVTLLLRKADCNKV